MDPDPDLLVCLPDNVKRNILARLCNNAAASTRSSAFASATTTPDAVAQGELAQHISGRLPRLPQMSAGAAVLDGVMSHEEIQAVAAAAEAWLSQHGTRPGMGSSRLGGLWHNPSYRGDIHCWITPRELTAAGQSLLAACLQMLASLRSQLTAQGYDVSGRCSCQLACYPGGGARYVRHTDASDSAPDRTVTALLYLNTDWDPQVDGGQLALYNTAYSTHPSEHISKEQQGNSSTPQQLNSTAQSPSSAAQPCQDDGARTAGVEDSCAAGYLSREPAVLVAPLGGRLLVFDSSLPHEVLPAHRNRLSITAWFYRASSGAAPPADATVVAGDAAAGSGKLPADAVAAGGSGDAQPASRDLQQAEELAAVQLHAGTAPQADGLSSTPQPAALPVSGLSTNSTDLLAPADTAAPTSAHIGAAAAAVAARSTAAAAAVDGPGCSARLLTIFVSIAAFRDDECQWTLRDLFLQATHPQRVFVGVVWQVDPEADDKFVRMAGGSRTAAFMKQVREVRCHYSTATGPCAARSRAQQLWAGEDYVLQVDAHMRFVQGWDELCISELQAAQQAAGRQSVVLSTYPLGYEGQGAAAAVPDSGPATLLCAKEFDEAGLLRVQSRCLCERPKAPVPSPFWAAGFSFAPSSWLLEVPYCPHLPHLFFGEEQYMLLRMWTWGWDVYGPSQPLAFHQWERSARANSYQACVKIDAAARAASQARVLGLTASSTVSEEQTEASAYLAPAVSSAGSWHPAKPAADSDWSLGGVWGLGTARSLQEYEKMAGVCFQKKTLEARALHGNQPPAVFESDQ